MCGIVGIWLKNESDIVQSDQLEASITAINHRGPDASKIKIDANVGLAHARLSIIDLSAKANQPMADQSGRYSLIFNGEIYNYKELLAHLPTDTDYHTKSDTEVLLNYLIAFGEDGIKKLNGFFSFLFFDHLNRELLFARDRFGIKPLMVYEDENQFIFGSELSAFFSFNINSALNNTAIDLLFQLTYIPAPHTILEHASVIRPGMVGRIKDGQMKMKPFFELAETESLDISYEAALKAVRSKIEIAVKRRLVSDVPLGTFLSGGVDSSIVSLVAKQYKEDLKTFSIGFDVPYFDESSYAVEMASSINSNHRQIQLNKSDFKEKFKDFLALNHQPFADSSAFAVYLLSKKTKEDVTVCLSGDGADELFGGYRKHEAEYKIRGLNTVKKTGIKILASLLKIFPQGRHGKWQETNRKIQKFSQGLAMSSQERYWRWLTFISAEEKEQLLKRKGQSKGICFKISEDLNSMLLADQNFVLPNDMLTKVDRMSMANSLEVRTPFLDFELVAFVNSLPFEFKINKKGRKQLLVDAFKDELPERIYNRPKKGFEIPLFDWLKEEIVNEFKLDYFSKTYIEEQGIFNYEFIKDLKKSVSTASFGNRVHLVWTLLIFQNWWHKTIWKKEKQ